MSEIREEIKKVDKDINYFEKYRQNLKKYAFEFIQDKENKRIKYYKILEEVDRMTLKIELLKNIKINLEKYREF
jgi:hypothetical protein